MNPKCPECKKGYLELDLDEKTCSCDSCDASFEAELLNKDENGV